MHTVKPHRISILGAGESGIGAALLARKQGCGVFVSDAGTIRPEYKVELSGHGIDFEEGTHTLSRILEGDLVVKSPGIPDTIPLLSKIREARKEIISEIEWGWRNSRSRVIAVTGSNGKTTTSSLIYHMMKGAGLDAVLCGNIGKSYARMLAEGKHDYWVLEISSFQLDGIRDFKPSIAIILNITPDHLDRYGYSLEAYADSKLRITLNQDTGDSLIIPDFDPVLDKALERNHSSATLYRFGDSPDRFGGAWADDHHIHWNINQTTTHMTLESLAIQGRHNVYNSMAAGIVGRLLDIRSENIRESLSDFQNIEHRLEKVAFIHDVEFINDSKATNVNATWFALESMNRPVVWIAGGTDKGNDYSILSELVRKRVKAIVCLGVDNENLIRAFSDDVEVMASTRSASDAVRTAYRIASPGDIVLLSPACASFDLFENYEDRGRQFKLAVREL